MKLYAILQEKTIEAPTVVRPRIPDGDLKQLHQRLVKQGWTRIGKGAFGSVYEGSNPRWVLKTFHDPAYFAYLEETRNSENPHFPQVGKRTRIGQDTDEKFPTYACMVEKLSKSRPLGVPLMKYLRFRIPHAHVGGREPFGNRSGDQRVREHIEHQYPRLDEAVGILVEFATRRQLNFDIMLRNIMWRGDVPVFTDPVYPEGA